MVSHRTGRERAGRGGCLRLGGAGGARGTAGTTHLRRTRCGEGAGSGAGRRHRAAQFRLKGAHALSGFSSNHRPLWASRRRRCRARGPSFRSALQSANSFQPYPPGGVQLSAVLWVSCSAATLSRARRRKTTCPPPPFATSSARPSARGRSAAPPAAPLASPGCVFPIRLARSIRRVIAFDANRSRATPTHPAPPRTLHPPRDSAPSPRPRRRGGPQKVLIVNTNGGGHANIGFWLAKTLAAQGHQVTLNVVGSQDDKKMQKAPLHVLLRAHRRGRHHLLGRPRRARDQGGGRHLRRRRRQQRQGSRLGWPRRRLAVAAGAKQFLFVSSAGMYIPTATPPHLEGDAVKESAGHAKVEAMLKTKPFKMSSFRPQYFTGYGNNKDARSGSSTASSAAAPSPSPAAATSSPWWPTPRTSPR